MFTVSTLPTILHIDINNIFIDTYYTPTYEPEALIILYIDTRYRLIILNIYVTLLFKKSQLTHVGLDFARIANLG
jgi:hypothetical protein